MRGGFLNILKPPGMTSHDVVAFLRKLLKIKKIGHSGTLDPSACGILLVAVDQATRLLEYLPSDKSYVAEATLGIATTTLDGEGEIVEERPLQSEISTEKLQAAFQSLTGEQWQRPPHYSAVKFKGEKLYQLARKGVQVEVPVRKIQIYSAELISREKGLFPRILFRTHCSSGTYIRTLVEELGKRLGYPAHLSFLIRDRLGRLELQSSYTLEEIEGFVSSGNLSQLWLPLDPLLGHIKRVVLDAGSTEAICVGKAIPSHGLQENEVCRLVSSSDELVAMGRSLGGFIQPEKVLAQR